jgi:hypothetical protein
MICTKLDISTKEVSFAPQNANEDSVASQYGSGYNLATMREAMEKVW